MIADENFHRVNRALHPFMYPPPHPLPVDSFETRYNDAFAFAREHSIPRPHTFAVIAMVKDGLR